jgi:phospho-N-acetylmuramoyl-pentapeptide-transferase
VFFWPFFKMPGGISVRMLYSLVTSFVICLLLSPSLINKLKEKQIGQNIREEGVQSHKKKAGVPTMGGMLILISMLVSVLFWAKPTKHVIVATVGLLWLGTVGFLDDYLKVIKKQSEGLSPRWKLLLQGTFTIGVALYLYFDKDIGQNVWIPLFAQPIHLGTLYIPFVVLVVVGACNAVNLTDGLDGLASGVVLIVALAYAAVAYLAGHHGFSTYLRIPYVKHVGELAVFCTAMAGACVGFLWYNSFPASIFMGDTGSLGLGGAIGIVALLVKQEIMLVLIGGIFVIEALSVIIQVVSFKTRKQRVFRMAPIHHHFELSGWAEPKVVIRFWIITLMLALGGLAVLGINRLVHEDEVTASPGDVMVVASTSKP